MIKQKHIIQTSVSKIKTPDKNNSCIMCESKVNLYRLTIAEINAESAYFFPLCNQCLKELADEIQVTLNKSVDPQ